MTKSPILSLLLAACTLNAQAANVTIDGGKRHQVIEGFGTCVSSQSPGP